MSAPRVAELLADPLLQGAELVGGASGIDREVDDLEFYDPAHSELSRTLVVCDELDVTPAFRLDAIVRRSESAGASAVLVIAARARPLLSGVRLADRLGIPVLWLAREDRFRIAVDLAIQLRAPLVERSATLLQLVREIGTKSDAGTIVAGISSVLSLPVSLLSPEGRPVVGGAPAVDQLRFDLDVPHRSAGVIVQPVTVDERTGAWIACEVGGLSDSRKATVAAVLQLCEPYLRTWLVAESARVDRDTAFLARLLDEIIAGADTGTRDMAERAIAVGWRLDEWHIGVHLVWDDPRAPADSGLAIEEIREALMDAGVILNGIASHSGGWAMWVNSTSEPTPDEVRQLLRGLRRAAAKLPHEWGVVAGVGRPHRGIVGLAMTISEARNAGYLARSREFRPSVDHSDELGVAQLLATLQQSEVTRAFAETALAPISGTGDEHLLATLKSYLQNGGSIVFTAQALGVHRNTVAARLQQLREKLGVDLDDPSQLLALQMAVRANRA
jgi:hypothetical protein